jgi:hypothetical protein
MSMSRQIKAHGVAVKRERVDPMTTRMFALAVVIVCILMAMYLALTASSVKLSVRVWALHNELADIQRQNSRLETEVARHSSIPVLQERSVRMGYGAAESIEYLIIGEP